MRVLVMTGDALTVDDVVDVGYGRARVELGPSVDERMAASRGVVASAVEKGTVAYGVTTGFGALADTYIPADELSQLQFSLVRSHAAGVGDPLPPEVVRALLLLRARTLAAGISGVRVDLPRRFLELLARDLLPVVPSKGSVGASGDLAQLAHLALPLIGEGRLRAPGDPAAGRPAAEVLKEHDLEPLVLQPKEALFGTDRAYDERVQVIRPHPGQLASAANLRALLADSPLLASHRFSEHAVQDSYSLRCAPQVHGSARDVVAHCRRVMEIELGSVVDNPVVVSDHNGGYEVMSTGNFHGQPLAFAADMLAMAVAEVASISERRVYRLLDPATSRGLPPFLAPHAGTNSGFMLAQYTAASVVSENKVLCHPASVDSIVTSGNQEDHVSMGWYAVRKAHEVLDNARTVLAVELLCAAQGIDLRAEAGAPGPATGAVHRVIRSRVPAMLVDSEMAPQIDGVIGQLDDVLAAAEDVIGPLQ